MNERLKEAVDFVLFKIAALPMAGFCAYDDVLRKVYTNINNVLEAYLSAEGLPEEKEFKFNSTVEEQQRIGFNEALSQARLVVMKKDARIAELERENERIKNEKAA